MKSVKAIAGPLLACGVILSLSGTATAGVQLSPEQIEEMADLIVNGAVIEVGCDGIAHQDEYMTMSHYDAVIEVDEVLKGEAPASVPLKFSWIEGDNMMSCGVFTSHPEGQSGTYFLSESSDDDGSYRVFAWDGYIEDEFSDPGELPVCPLNEEEAEPSAEPSAEPTAEPGAEPTAEPTAAEPTAEPSAEPTAEPTAAEPTAEPTAAEPTAGEPSAEGPGENAEAELDDDQAVAESPSDEEEVIPFQGGDSAQESAAGDEAGEAGCAAAGAGGAPLSGMFWLLMTLFGLARARMVR